MKFLYDLACGHIRLLDNRITDLSAPVRCAHCGESGQFKGVHLTEWHARCLYQGCTFGKWTGESREESHRASNRHHMSSGHMDIDVEYVTNPASMDEQKRLIRLGIVCP